MSVFDGSLGTIDLSVAQMTGVNNDLLDIEKGLKHDLTRREKYSLCPSSLRRCTFACNRDFYKLSQQLSLKLRNKYRETILTLSDGYECVYLKL
jgi:hypothetical protein